ncbi:ribosome small subunit-dependent GTPase A [Flavobacteriales bacterium]|nr:ribosome small subunit-dependent GTPase A [Flavobacteriales bacterium]
MQAVVIKSTGSWYIVKTEDGEELNCRIRGKFRIQGIKSTNPIVVGDQVIITQEEESFIISELLERRNYIVRKSVNLSKQTHIIASNVDQAILVATIKSPTTSTSFIDRILVAAKSYGVDVAIVFNKVDLLNKQEQLQLQDLISLYQKIGHQCFSLAILKDDLSSLKETMKGKVNVICGHSGVGKSTLLNMIQPDLDIITQEISLQHQQGMHTTTFSEMHELDFGAKIIDTPGIRGFGLVEINQSELCHYFPEFFALKAKCKYNNCIHVNEPNCGVKEAIENNQVAESRYKSYLSMLESDDEHYRVNKYE